MPLIVGDASSLTGTASYKSHVQGADTAVDVILPPTVTAVKLQEGSGQVGVLMCVCLYELALCCYFVVTFMLYVVCCCVCTPSTLPHPLRQLTYHSTNLHNRKQVPMYIVKSKANVIEPVVNIRLVTLMDRKEEFFVNVTEPNTNRSSLIGPIYAGELATLVSGVLSYICVLSAVVCACQALCLPYPPLHQLTYPPITHHSNYIPTHEHIHMPTQKPSAWLPTRPQGPIPCTRSPRAPGLISRGRARACR